ncbi:MAG: lipase/acyltransferase domain-containing protein [Nanobdellota archaeon]
MGIITKTKKTKKKNSSAKRVKKILFCIVGVIMLLLAIYLVFGLKVHFIFNEEMNLDMDPSENSYSIVNDDTSSVTFTYTADTPVVCKAYCRHQFIDLSTGQVIETRNTTDPQHHKSTYDLPTPEYGSGQKIYQFQVSCQSKKTDLCRSSEKIYRKTSLVIVNYNLSEEEQLWKKSILPVLQQAIDEESVVLTILEQARILSIDISEQLEHETPSELEQLQNTSDQVERVHAEFLNNIISTLELWEHERYLDISPQKNMELATQTATLSREADDLKTTLYYITSKWNQSIKLLDYLHDKDVLFNEVQTFYKKSLNSSMYNNGLVLKRNVTRLATAPLDGKVGTLEDFSDNLSSHLSQVEDFLTNHTQRKNHFLKRINTTNIIALDVIEEYNSTLAQELTFDTSNLSNVCGAQQELVKAMEKHNLDAVHYQTTTRPYLDNTTVTEEVCTYYQDHLYLDVTNGTTENFELNESYENITIDGYGVFNYSTITDKEFERLCLLDGSRLIPEHQLYYCTSNYTYDDGFLHEIIIDSYKPVMVENVTVSSSLPQMVPENEPRCCFKNDCTTCCDANGNCENNHPIIFVHGHALSKYNSPELSLIAFSQMQDALQDEGYINAGEIADESELFTIPENDWGRVDTPISVRVSYYYMSHFDIGDSAIVTQKTERIENYALRLKELVDLVKYRSSSDKVIIISHSMGGLVSREYLRLFGSEDVDTLVMIGTPNYGIEGSVNKYCSVTGASKECEDMGTGSLFLRRLNAAQQDGISGTEVYTIRGSGCEMDDGRDGDGVILAENVPLDFATNYLVNGSCPDSFFEDTMHTRLVKPEEYPEVYELVLEILNE